MFDDFEPEFRANQPPNLTVYAPPAWNNPDATQLDFMQYSIPNKGVLPVGTIMQFPTGAQPSDYSLLVDGQSTTDSQFVIPQSVTWTTGALPFSNGVNDAIWTGLAFVVVGNGGKIATSPDGITWTNRTSGTTNDITNIAYNATTGKLNALVGNAVLSSSDNGTTWVNLGVANSNAILVAVAPMESGFIILGYGDTTRYWYIISVSSLGVFTTLKSFQLNSVANQRTAGKNGLTYLGNNKLFLGVHDNDTINNSSLSAIYFFNTNSQVLTQITTHGGIAGSRNFSFFKIGVSCFVKNTVGSYPGNLGAMATAKVFTTSKIKKYLVTDSTDYNFSNPYKKIPIVALPNSILFYKGQENSSKSYTGNLISGDRIVANNNLILTFQNAANATYSIATPSANCVTSVPYEPDDGNSWYIKTFV